MKRIFLTLIVASLIGLSANTASHADSYTKNQQNNQQQQNNSRYYPFGNKNGWNTNSNNTNNRSQQTNQNTNNRPSGNSTRSGGFYPLGSDIRDARQHSSGYGNTGHGNN